MKMHTQSPARMSPDEIIQEIKELRGEMEHLTERLFELSRVLYAKARHEAIQDSRNPSHPAFVLYANAWTRFSGVVGQGLKRTSSADRVLKIAQQHEQDRQDQERREQEAEERRIRKAANPSLVPSPGVEDLVALYGQEVMDDYASK